MHYHCLLRCISPSDFDVSKTCQDSDRGVFNGAYVLASVIYVYSFTADKDNQLHSKENQRSDRKQMTKQTPR